MARTLLLVSAVCVVTFLFGVELSEACSCYPIDNPVCGEDGITYRSECFLFCHNWDLHQKNKPPIKKKCDGKCECCDPKPCGCDRCYDPVCGENNVTYPNPCILACENKKRQCQNLSIIEVRCKKACEECPLPCGCSKRYDPVCGEDNVTYNNLCVLECENKKRKCQGMPFIDIRCKRACKDCPRPCSGCNCNSIYKPVCGLDGKTYTNQCWLDCVNEERKKKGLVPIGVKCKTACRGCPSEEPCICPTVVCPVCGSNGVTFSNECMLDCENQKRKNKGLPLIHLCCKKGCEKCINCKDCNCPKIYSPVCGSDNATYGNICQFNCENKYRDIHGIPNLTLRCKRPCNECVTEKCDCPKSDSPVCGTDGKTYSNICLLDCENCKNHNHNLPIIKVQYHKKCEKYIPQEECICPAVDDPVCGSDGKTYCNICKLNCVNKERKKKSLPPIIIKYTNKCVDCSEVKLSIHQAVYEPVCGRNGKTYGNIGLLICENEKRRKIGLSEIRICCKKDCKKCPECTGCSCPNDDNPVCGSDGFTYGNICKFNSENKYLESQGLPMIRLRCNRPCHECLDENCNCPKIYCPVCGSDKRTYGNICLFESENVRRHNKKLPHINILCKKACKDCLPTHEDCTCADVYHPVCGLDGKTYRNQCMLDRVNRERKKKGLPEIEVKCNNECKYCPKLEPCNCHDLYAPVCGSDGNDYTNECYFLYENERRKNKGLPQIYIRCKSKCQKCPKHPSCNCPKNYSPVCGSDGFTYKNLCEFGCENIYRKENKLTQITVRCVRPCDECLNEECKCPDYYNPVCGTDRNTYNNICFLEQENVRRHNQNMPRIEVLCQKACKDSPRPKLCDCTDQYTPVCGLDGKTYTNQCWLDCINKERKIAELPIIGTRCKTACRGCPPDDTNICPTTDQPVCGSNGVTYKNDYLLDCENKKRKKLGLSIIRICCKKDCKKCPECTGCSCPNDDNPVCGSDGFTYGNICKFNIENKYLESQGLPTIRLRCNRPCHECLDENCNCPKIYCPVCGSDKRTYGNICLFESENVRRHNKKLPHINILCKKACKDCLPTHEDCTCADVYHPVCGLDGKTYRNQCMLDRVNRERKKKGLPDIEVKCNNECKFCPKLEPCNCHDLYAPVCGSDGNDYTNECYFLYENERRKNKGLPQIYVRCKSKCQKCPQHPSCNCPKNYSPVCGSDGFTYKNLCELGCENIYRKENKLTQITVRCVRPCDECLNEECKCPDYYNPVCGTDRSTYDNICFLEYENVRRHNQNMPRIEVLCQKACKDSPKPKLCDCTDQYTPVCGLDGKTYTNQCWLDCINKERKIAELPIIGTRCKTACRGCPPDDTNICSTTDQPVCGSNGVTYKNNYLLDCENKKRKKLGLSIIRICCNKDCKKCPECTGCTCPIDENPVCGSDGFTYGNVCKFNNENKYLKSQGLPIITMRCKRPCHECLDENCNCPKIYCPVCGSDKRTYSNICLFESENVRRHNEKLPHINIRCHKACKDCLPPHEDCICADVYHPVCGSDGTTYNNRCRIDCLNRERKSKGLPEIDVKCNNECKNCPKHEPCNCHDLNAPVCGSDGKDYKNECFLLYENKQRKNQGLPQIYIRCKSKCQKCQQHPSCNCPKTYSPICGSDGFTYKNLCEFGCENVYRKDNNLSLIKIRCMRSCDACLDEECKCPEFYNPVCGTDRNTYDNICFLEHENVRRHNRNMPRIEVLCQKSCQDCPSPKLCDCTDEYAPVCGLDGKTYTNQCWLDFINNERKNAGMPIIGIRCETACRGCPPDDTCICPAIVKPVCGSNGVTYNNDCLLDCINKERQKDCLPKINLCCKRDCKYCPECGGCSCPKSHDPVCGSDNITYGNLCLFEYENKYRNTHGLPKIILRCKRPCNECVSEACDCPKIASPVCGSDFKTYGNMCLLKCENKKRHNQNLPPIEVRCKRDCKICEEESRRCTCNSTHSPVCGSNNVTYNSYCMFDCENFNREQDDRPLITIRCKRPCDHCVDETCKCTKIKSPVCGSDNKTYSNMCLLEWENKNRKKQNLPPLTVRCKHECKVCIEEEKHCTCGCIHAPVCGSNNVTYNNLCQLHCENFHRELDGRPKITVHCEKPCEKCVDEPCNCPKHFVPVCGSDNKTYGNLCLFDRENNKRQNENLPSIELRCKRECKYCDEEKKRCSCDFKNYDPICGSDDVTYSNFCEFDCGNFHRQLDGLPAIRIVCHDVCDRCCKECSRDENNDADDDNDDNTDDDHDEEDGDDDSDDDDDDED